MTPITASVIAFNLFLSPEITIFAEQEELHLHSIS